MKNHGFTLIELSIALIIIGLWMGGILVGQSMIRSAKINAFVRQIQQYDISVSNFQLRYKAIPGDLHGFSAAAVGYGPDGFSKDGVICDDDCAQNNLGYETGYFWKDLSINDNAISMQACGLKTFAANFRPYTSGEDCSFPPTKLQDNSLVFVAALIESNGAGGWATSPAQWKNYYVVATITNVTGTFFADFGTYANINAADVMAVDIKSDDGKKSTGSVLAVSQADLDQYGGQGWGASGEGSGGALSKMGEFVSANVRAGTPALCGDFCYANVPDYIATEKYIFAVRMLKDQSK